MTRQQQLALAFVTLALGAVAFFAASGARRVERSPSFSNVSGGRTVGGSVSGFPPPGTGSTSGVRGLRNNNPGNIRRTGDQWRGMAAEQTDPEFVVFESPLWGLRAMAVLLKNYRSRHGLDTIEGIITRWAPPNENDTASYIRSVERQTGIGAREVLNFRRDLLPVMEAIIFHENGSQPYAPALIQQGIDLA